MRTGISIILEPVWRHSRGIVASDVDGRMRCTELVLTRAAFAICC